MLKLPEASVLVLVEVIFVPVADITVGNCGITVASAVPFMLIAFPHTRFIELILGADDKPGPYISTLLALNAGIAKNLPLGEYAAYSGDAVVG